MITLGIIVLLFVVYQLFGTNLTEARNQSQLEKQFVAATAHQTTHQTTHSQPDTPPTTAQPNATTSAQPDVLPAVPSGGAVDHLVIPAIHVDKFVVEGTDEADLRRGPGHYAGTPYPGQPGNVGIAGHRTTYGAPFFELNELKPGDLIELTDLNDRTWDYVVSQNPIVVSPTDVSVIDPTPFPQLTLTTCNPRFSATSRMVVFARLKGQAGLVKSPPTTVAANQKASVLPGDKPAAGQAAAAAITTLNGGRSSAWSPALLYGLLTVALWVGTRLAINRTRRWYRLAAYVVGIGVCLIPLWFCFENVVLLLPQSI